MKEYTIGSWITIGHLSIAEILAGAGFDWLCIDLEHSVIDYQSLQILLTAIQAKNIKGYVRVGDNDATIIKRVLDAGADGIICPMISTKEEAEKLVSYVKYPPIGKRGVGLARAQNYGLDGGFPNYRNHIADEIPIIAQIEHYEGVNNLAEILSVDGIDGTFIGPFDLSGSLGKPGQYDDDDVKEVMRQYEVTAAASNKLMGYHVIEPDVKLVQDKISKGYNFIAFSLDSLFLGESCRTHLKDLKSNLE